MSIGRDATEVVKEMEVAEGEESEPYMIKVRKIGIEGKKKTHLSMLML